MLLSERLLFLLPLLRDGLLFGLGLCIYIIGSQINIIFGNPSVTLFNGNFYETIGLIGNGQLLRHGNQSCYRYYGNLKSP